MRHVESSAIEMIGYDDRVNVLAVKFTTGVTYLYSAVPRSMYEQLMAAESKGTFVNRIIKPRYPSRRL